MAKKKSGYSKKSTDWLGRPITENYNAKGEKTGYNKKGTNIWGTPIVERHNAKGEVTGYSKKGTNVWGTPIIQHYTDTSVASPPRTPSTTYPTHSTPASGSDTPYERHQARNGSGVAFAFWAVCVIVGLIWISTHKAPQPSLAPTTDNCLIARAGPRFGPTAVWNPPNIVWEKIQNECRSVTASGALSTCVTPIMEKAGASRQAVAFTRLLGGEGYMESFHQSGGLGVVSAFLPFRANDNDAFYIVNGSPPLIEVDEIGTKIDIRKDPLYPALVRKYPNVMLWGWGHTDFQKARPMGTGQMLIFRMILLNGCHGCEVAGYASVGLEFDASGRLLGTKLLALSPEQPSTEPSQRSSSETGN